MMIVDARRDQHGRPGRQPRDRDVWPVVFREARVPGERERPRGAFARRRNLYRTDLHSDLHQMN